MAALALSEGNDVLYGLSVRAQTGATLRFRLASDRVELATILSDAQATFPSHQAHTDARLLGPDGSIISTADVVTGRTYRLQGGGEYLTVFDLFKRLFFRKFPSFPSILLDVLAVGVGLLLVAAMAQKPFSAPLPMWWTKKILRIETEDPIPFTMQTYAVWLVGVMLGFKLGMASLSAYYLAVLAGAPFGAGGAHGWQVVAYGHGGYFVGFIFAAGFVGYASSKWGWDRQLWRSLCMMVIGNFIIYLFGVTWLPIGFKLQYHKNVFCGAPYGCVGNVIVQGCLAFIPGDLLKIIAAFLTTSAVWFAMDKWAARRSFTYSSIPVIEE